MNAVEREAVRNQARRPHLHLRSCVPVQRRRNDVPVRGSEICQLPRANPGQVCKDVARDDLGHHHAAQTLRRQGLWHRARDHGWMHSLPPDGRDQVQGRQVDVGFQVRTGQIRWGLVCPYMDVGASTGKCGLKDLDMHHGTDLQ